MRVMKIVSKNLEETKKIAKNIVQELSLKNMANVIALEGDLGSGKTTLTQAIGGVLGVKENMHSPTFVIMKVYKIENPLFKKLIHIDAYRLEEEKELLHLGWEEILNDRENLVIIEWPERVPNLIPLDAKRINLSFIDEDTREIEYEN